MKGAEMQQKSIMTCKYDENQDLKLKQYMVECLGLQYGTVIDTIK